MIDRINIEAVFQYGPDRHTVSVPIDPAVIDMTKGAVLFEAMDCAVKTAGVREGLLRAKIPLPQMEFAEKERGGYGGYIRQHPLCDPGRELEPEEESDMERCIYTYAGKFMNWAQLRLPNYTAGWGNLSDYEPMVALQCGRRLAIIKRVVCVNEGDWNRPPLYIPTGWGIHLYLERIRELRPCFAPATWILELQDKLGATSDSERKAVDEARMRIKLPPWGK